MYQRIEHSLTEAARVSSLRPECKEALFLVSPNRRDDLRAQLCPHNYYTAGTEPMVTRVQVVTIPEWL